MKKRYALCVALVVIIAALGCLCLSSCNTNPTLDRDYSLSFNAAKTVVWNYPGIPIIFDSQQSGLELTKDGVATITILINSKVSDLLKSFDVDLSMASSLNLANIADLYGVPILPWFDITDMKASLKKLEESLGAELILDYEEEATKKILTAIETTGRLPEDLSIPAKFGVRYTGNYVVKHLKSEISGEEYTALYIDKYSEGGEPFFIMTLTDNEGKMRASMNVEFLQMKMVFDERELT